MKAATFQPVKGASTLHVAHNPMRSDGIPFATQTVDLRLTDGPAALFAGLDIATARDVAAKLIEYADDAASVQGGQP